MIYTFSNLSPADFEDLARDAIGLELSVRFEAFALGPDGGMDGRHAASGKKTILQAKHYAGSRFPALLSTMKRERTSIERLAPSRYLLATSQSLTPLNKASLSSAIGPTLGAESDIFGREDLNDLIRRFPEIERNNIKLWLSSTTVLERVLRAATHKITAITREEIEAKVAVYAPNPSFKEAQEKLEAEHVVIISGPPGVGKTTLAEMISYAYLSEGWEYVAIRSLEDGFASISDSQKQIFFFDDFLGRASLDAKALAAKDSDLARFIRRVRKSKNARFVLTTRTPIFEEARRISEHLADKHLDITRYALDVGVYTRRIRARILYNHLVVAGTPKNYIRALWDADAIPPIVDHKNYNPRIIEAMTDSMHVREVSAAEYPSKFLEALNNPLQIWDVSFRNHIPAKCKHLLYSLFFCSQYGVEIDKLKGSFNSLHSHLCIKFSISFDPKDFEEALKILEGGFIEIRRTSVSYINPSLRDYMTSYLDDVGLLAEFACSVQDSDWTYNLWTFVSSVKQFSAAEQKRITAALLPTASRLTQPTNEEIGEYHIKGISNCARIELLISWYIASKESAFISYATKLAETPIHGFVSWQDGVRLVNLVSSLKDGTYKSVKQTEDLKVALETALLMILDGYLWPDDLEQICDAIEDTSSPLSDDIISAKNRAIRTHIDNVSARAAEMEAESTLQDYISALKRHAPKIGISEKRINEAVGIIEERISDLNEETDQAPSPAVTTPARQANEIFNDTALSNLFAPLVAP